MGKERCLRGLRAVLAGEVVMGSMVSGEEGGTRMWSPQRAAWDSATHMEGSGQSGGCNSKGFAG